MVCFWCMVLHCEKKDVYYISAQYETKELRFYFTF